jgi:ketosteroid isomerase-like protein
VGNIRRKKADASPKSLVHAERSRALINAFFDGFEKLNVGVMLESWHERGIQIYPHSSESHINQLKGRDAIQRKYLKLVGCFNSVRISDRTFHFIDKSNLVWVEFRAAIQIKTTGKVHTNSYACLITIEDNRIIQYKEYSIPFGFLAPFAKFIGWE